MKRLAEQLREAFIATMKSIPELTVGMVVQVRIRGIVQKVGIVRSIDPEKKSATVEDWWMRGKMTAYDDRYTFYEISPPKEAVFAGEQTEEFAEFGVNTLQNGMIVQVRSRADGKIVATGRVEDVDWELGCVRVVEKDNPRMGDMAQEYCKGGYQFFVWTVQPVGMAISAPGY